MMIGIACIIRRRYVILLNTLRCSGVGETDFSPMCVKCISIVTDYYNGPLWRVRFSKLNTLFATTAHGREGEGKII